MTSGSNKPSSKVPDAAPLKRRGVLLAGAAAAGAGAATLVAKGLPVAESTPVAGAAAVPREQPGYQLTQHVQRYYETAKV